VLRQEIEAAGFRLAGEADFLRNRKIRGTRRYSRANTAR